MSYAEGLSFESHFLIAHRRVAYLSSELTRRDDEIKLDRWALHTLGQTVVS